MYKALIIDNEKEAIENVVSAFNWKSLSVTEIVKISDTKDLSKRIVSEHPHIVFIDIEMGNVLGLNIIEECCKLVPDTLFVIISGYDSFEYAKTAVRLDVVYYLLKPFADHDVDLATNKLMNYLNIRFGSRMGIILNDINSFLYDGTNFQKFLVDDGLSFSKKHRFIVSRMEKMVVEDIKLCLREKLVKRYQIGQKKYLFIIEGSLDENNTILLENIINFNKMSIGISEEFEYPEQMFSCFKQANMLACGDFIDSSYRIYQSGQAHEDEFDAFMETVQMFLEGKNPEKLKTILQKLPALSREKHFNMEEVVIFYNYVIIRLNLILRKNKTMDYLSVLSFEELVNEYNDIESMCEFLLNIVETILGSQTDDEIEIDNTTSNYTVQQIAVYLKENYSQKIRIKDLSDMFFISEAYLSEVFKKLTHKTIIEYLTDIRIESAKDMLINSCTSISNVAEATGYRDCCYFNKIFKKYTGDTPYQYRKKYKGNVEIED